MAPATPPAPPPDVGADPWDTLETGGSLDDLPADLRAAADRVVEHLAVLRGAGPFLSSVDARLLVGWLGEGVGVALLCTAIERVAQRRRARRVKSPLSLRSCRGEVKRLRSGQVRPAPVEAAPPGPSAPVEGDLGRLAEAALAALDGLSGERDTDIEAAIEVVRRFHADAWEAASAEHAALRAAAEAELAPFRPAMDPAEWELAVEEVARDHLRQRFPLLSASTVWDRLQGP